MLCQVFFSKKKIIMESKQYAFEGGNSFLLSNPSKSTHIPFIIACLLVKSIKLLFFHSLIFVIIYIFIFIFHF